MSTATMRAHQEPLLSRAYRTARAGTPLPVLAA